MANVEKLNLVIGAKDKASNTLKRIRNSVIAVGGAYLGWQAAKNIIGGIIDAGMEAETVWNDVAASLDRHGYSIDDNLVKIKAFGAEMQETMGIGDELAGVSIQTLLDYNNDLATSFELVKVAADLSAGGHMDMKAAMDLVGKASVGYTGTLSRYGIIIDESIPKQEKFAAAIEQINSRFGGAAAARMVTTAGKVQLLKDTFEDLQQELFALATEGEGVGEALGNITEGIKTLTGYIQPFSDGLLIARAGVKDFWDALTFNWGDETEMEKLVQRFIESGKIWDRLGVDAAATNDDVNDSTNTVINTKQEMIDTIGLEIDKIHEAQAARSEYLQTINQELGITIPMAEFGDDFVEEIVKLEDKKREALDVTAIYEMNLYNALLEAYGQTSEEKIEIKAREMVAIGQMTARQAADWRDSKNKELQEQKQFADGFMDIMGNAGDQIADGLFTAMQGGRFRMQDVFMSMGQDFIKLFLNRILKSKAVVKFVDKLLAIIGFHNPANDLKAMQSGADYAHYFTMGFENNMRNLSGPSFTTPQLNMAGAGGGSPSVVVNFNGPITDKKFVRNFIVPEIERAAAGRHSKLQIRNRLKTGGLNEY